MLLFVFFDRFRAENTDATIVTASFDPGRKLVSCVEFPPGSLRGVKRSQLPRNRNALFLFDGAPPFAPPKSRMVCFSKPDPSWLRTVEKEAMHCEIYMPVWTLSELLGAAAKLGLPLEPETIEARFRFLGGSARYCLSLHSVERTVRRVRRTLAGFELEQVEMCLVRNPQTAHIREHVFHAAPDCTDCPLPHFGDRFIASEEIQKILEVIVMKSPQAPFDWWVKSLVSFREDSIPMDSAVLDWLFAIHVARTFNKGVDRLELSRISKAADRMYLAPQMGVFERPRPTSIPEIDGVFSAKDSGITFFFHILPAEKQPVNAFRMWELLAERNQLHLLSQNKVVMVLVDPLNRKVIRKQSVEIPEFPLKEATDISSIPGFGPVDLLELHRKRIRTAHDLRIHIGGDVTLDKYRSRLETFEQWHNFPDARSSLALIPQFRLIIPDERKGVYC